MTFYTILSQHTAAARAALLASPAIELTLRGAATRDIYVQFLTQAYHHVRHTVPLFECLLGRLPVRLGWLHSAVAHYIEEERGHEQWVLNDIEAAGGDRPRAAQSQPAIATEAMVAYAYDTVMRGNPVGLFGMVYVLEGTSAALALNAADTLQRTLHLPNKAFSYLRSHGQLDQEHTQHLEDLLERLTEEHDRNAVEHCAQAVYWLYGQVFRSIDTSRAAGVRACG